MRELFTLLAKIGGLILIFGILFSLSCLGFLALFREDWLLELGKSGFVAAIVGLWLIAPKFIQVIYED